jgi:hypothetical protein
MDGKSEKKKIIYRQKYENGWMIAIEGWGFQIVFLRWKK